MKKLKLILFTFLGFTSLQAQEVLLKEQAVQIALENNYDIKVANNNVEVARNNTSIYNSGFLPTVSSTAGANYNNTDTEIELVSGENFSIDGAESTSLNASLAVNYTLFDGTGRMYSYKRLKENYNLTELQARLVIENALLSLFTSYYQVARLTENLNNLKFALTVSQKRKQRAKYNFELGQGTRLDVLNAEVDVDNDSVNYLNTKQQLANSVRDLNVILGQDVNKIFKVDTNVIYTEGLTKSDVLNQALNSNVSLLEVNKNIEMSTYDIRINQSGWIPKLSASGSYGWNYTDNGAAAVQLLTQSSLGLSAGLTLSWNIFDGGGTKTRVQNARISRENQTIVKEQIQQQLTRDVANQWETYQNALFIMDVRSKTLQTNQLNFKRSEEQYTLGQITSIEFRQAQLNLLNASNSYNESKYDAKLAELRLLQLGGGLMGAKY